MKKIVLATTLIASVLASALSASANTYIEPGSKLDGYKFFNSLPTGQ